MKMKILVTAAGTVLGQAVIKSIKLANLDTTIVALNADKVAAGVYWADRHYIVPRANESSYMGKVREVIDIERPDLILIGIEPEYKLFSAVKHELECMYRTKVIVSPRKVLEIAEDKWLTYTFLKEHDLEYPHSCLPGGEEELINKVGFPLVVKPRSGAESVGVHTVHSKEELAKIITEIDNPIIQECVGSADEEYTAGVVIIDGRVISSITMKRVLKYGNTLAARAEPYSDVNKYLEKVALLLNGYGPINLQYRLVNNKVKVFEINARFSGTTYFRSLSQVNEVELIVNYLFTNKQISQPTIRPVQILRYYEEMIIPEKSGDIQASVSPPLH